MSRCGAMEEVSPPPPPHCYGSEPLRYPLSSWVKGSNMVKWMPSMRIEPQTLWLRVRGPIQHTSILTPFWLSVALMPLWLSTVIVLLNALLVLSSSRLNTLLILISWHNAAKYVYQALLVLTINKLFCNCSIYVLLQNVAYMYICAIAEK